MNWPDLFYKIYPEAGVGTFLLLVACLVTIGMLAEEFIGWMHSLTSGKKADEKEGK
jgi:hypothetical protein